MVRSLSQLIGGLARFDSLFLANDTNSTYYQAGTWIDTAMQVVQETTNNPAVGIGTGASVVMRYHRIGMLCNFKFALVLGSGIAPGTGRWMFQLPFPGIVESGGALTMNASLGWGWASPSGTNYVPALCTLSGSPVGNNPPGAFMYAFAVNSTTSPYIIGLGGTGAGTPAGASWATGGFVRGAGVYQVAPGY